MSISEQEFIYGLLTLCIISFVIKHVSMFVFIDTLSEEDKAFLEKEQPENVTGKITYVLTCIYFIASLSFFINSAILVAIGIHSLTRS